MCLASDLFLMTGRSLPCCLVVRFQLSQSPRPGSDPHDCWFSSQSLLWMRCLEWVRVPCRSVLPMGSEFPAKAALRCSIILSVTGLFVYPTQFLKHRVHSNLWTIFLTAHRTCSPAWHATHWPQLGNREGFIGASLSEPHINGTAIANRIYVYIIIIVHVRRSLTPYTCM